MGHLRGSAVGARRVCGFGLVASTEANVLQLVFAALVEPPYEVAVVEIDVDEPSLA